MIDLRLLIKRKVFSHCVPPTRGTHKMRSGMVKWIRDRPFRLLGKAMAEDIHRASARPGFVRRFLQAD